MAREDWQLDGGYDFAGMAERAARERAEAAWVDGCDECGAATGHHRKCSESPIDVIDYCSHGCPDGSVTAWDGEVCGCCGGAWGADEDSDGICRGVHIVGWNPDPAPEVTPNV